MLAQKIREVTGKYEDLRLRKTVIDTNRQDVTYTFCTKNSLSEEQKKQIRALTYKFNDNSYECYIKFMLDTFTNEEVEEIIQQFMDDHPSIKHRLTTQPSILLNDGKCDIAFDLDKLTFQIFENAQIKQQLQSTFTNISALTFNISIMVHSSDTKIDTLKEQVKVYQQISLNAELSKPKRFNKVVNVERFVGKKILSQPRYIIDLVDTQKSCVVCGKISNFNILESKKTTAIIYKFTLTDYSGSIQAVAFGRNDVALKLSTLRNDLDALVCGAVSFSNYSKQLELKVYDISLCNILPMEENVNTTKPMPEKYLLIKPTKVAVPEQIKIGGEKTCEYLQNNVIVTLDLKSSGQKVLEDKVYSINCTKIENGKITSGFSTLINPEIILDIEGVDNAKLIESPTITDIIPDLFKFCANSVVVGLNIEVAMSFIKYYATGYGYYFNNINFDFIQLSQNYLLGRRLSDKKKKKVNYSTLSEIFQTLIQEEYLDTSLSMAVCLLEMFVKDNNLL
ncbi:MAG: hypothetical protein RR248_03460 [Clostridia bacterium]